MSGVCCFVDYAGGWLCFIVSIIWIGILTALVGDLASHMGCTIKLKDSVTAISFVALGTSVPGKYTMTSTSSTPISLPLLKH